MRECPSAGWGGTPRQPAGAGDTALDIGIGHGEAGERDGGGCGIVRLVLSRERLTDREQVVLQELASGKTTKEIAGTLVVSEETVKTHLAHIYQKLGVNDRVQAVALALRRGLVR